MGRHALFLLAWSQNIYKTIGDCSIREYASIKIIYMSLMNDTLESSYRLALLHDLNLVARSLVSGIHFQSCFKYVTTC